MGFVIRASKKARGHDRPIGHTDRCTMSEPSVERDCLSARELSDRTGVSLPTIWRLKSAGKIPFFQPGGKGTVVRFPADAFEQGAAQSCAPSSHERNQDRLSGPRPAWMAAEPNKNE